MENSRRNQKVDAIRGMAILLMVIGHCIQYLSGAEWEQSGSFIGNGLFKTIYSFHMPLFAFVSGWLFRFSHTKYAFGSLIVRRIKSLFIPIISYNVLRVLIEIVRGGTLNRITAYAERFINSLWFLWTILFCSMLIIFIEGFSKRKMFIYAFIIVIGIFLPDVWITRYFKWIFPYFLGGYFINKNYTVIDDFIKKIADYLGLKRVLILMIGWIISVICHRMLLSRFNFDSYIYWSGCYLFNGKGFRYMAYVDCFRWLIGGVGIAMTAGAIYIAYDMSKAFDCRIIKKCINILAWFGASSMGIYYFSDLMFNCGIKEIASGFSGLNYVALVIEVGIVLMLCCILTQCTKKSKLLTGIILGGR